MRNQKKNLLQKDQEQLAVNLNYVGVGGKFRALSQLASLCAR